MFHPDHKEKSILIWLAHGLVQMQGVLDAAVFGSYPSVKNEYRLLYEQYRLSFIRNRESSKQSAISLSSRPTADVTENSTPTSSDRVSGGTTINPIVANSYAGMNAA